MGMNMLSAKKVKLHGMQDSRWNVNDHLTQYKGLVKLFQRDRKIIDFDTKLTAKKNKKEIKQILKDIFTRRQELECCSAVGDQQNIRNLLSEERHMKMAYQELHVYKIIDHIYQDNFTSRKMLDLLNYRLQQKVAKLIKLRLDEGDLQNLLRFDVMKRTPLDIQIGIVTGKVQDMTLKKEAAITVRDTYDSLIHLMRKDAIYYDAVLQTLRDDALNQCHCIIHTTKLGQMATEYLDDRKVEFETLQSAVKTDMKMRLKTLEKYSKTRDETIAKMHQLIRRDSDITVSQLPPLTNAPSFTCLTKDIKNLAQILKRLQDTTMVSNFNCIFPCMKEQLRQYDRLEEVLKTAKAGKDRIFEQKEHAEQVAMKLTNSIVVTTYEYKDNKKILLDGIQEQRERHMRLTQTNSKRGTLLTNIRNILQSLDLTTHKVQADQNKQGVSQRFKSDDSITIMIEKMETDGLNLIRNIQTKVEALVKANFDDAVAPAEALTFYGQLIEKSSKYLDTKTASAEADLWDEMMMEDTQIPTRDFIKEQSKEICHIAAMAEI